jgi:hypothetical protein
MATYHDESARSGWSRWLLIAGVIVAVAVAVILILVNSGGGGSGGGGGY